jgi:hypothetical protein
MHAWLGLPGASVEFHLQQYVLATTEHLVHMLTAHKPLRLHTRCQHTGAADAGARCTSSTAN